MKAAGILDFATDLQHPAFAGMAEAAGLRGLTVETPEQTRPMIIQALQHDGPALVDVHVSRQEVSMPLTISLEQMNGFSLFMLKAVLSGCGHTRESSPDFQERGRISTPVCAIAHLDGCARLDLSPVCIEEIRNDVLLSVIQRDRPGGAVEPADLAFHLLTFDGRS
jgi:hypothetical protein